MDPHVIERLSAYMDRELSDPQRSAVAAHLQECPSCARRLTELQAVDAAARGLPLAVPEGYFEAFRDRLRHRLARVRPARRLAPLWVGAAAAALVLAVLTPRLLREPGAPAAPARTLPESARYEAASAPPPALEKAAPAPRMKEARHEAPEPRKLADRATPPATTHPAGTAIAQKAAPASSGYAAPPAEADRLERAPRAATRMETTEAAARRDEEKGNAARDTARFHLLLRRSVSSADQARALREAWRAFARDEAAGPHADEARVRAIEAGAEAWRRGKDETDRGQARKEAGEYLDRPDALQADRVRDVLRALSP